MENNNNIKINTTHYSFWITQSQYNSLQKLYNRYAEIRSLDTFIESCMAEYRPETTNETNAVPILVNWCNMLMCIEKDGYTHS